MILLVRLVLFLGIVLLFVVTPPLMLGFGMARQLSWWTKHDKVKGYVTLSSSRFSKWLIPQYSGYNTQFSTNIPGLYNRFYLNEHPYRLSILGAVDYGIVAIISVFWVYHMVGYFFFLDFSNPNIPLIVILLMGHAVVAFLVAIWNQSARRNPVDAMTRAEWKQYKKRL